MKPLAQNSLIQNRYLIVQLIGKGGMGEVYLAVDQRLGSAIALKRTYFAGDDALGSAFEREARVLARLRHPVLPKVSDHFGEGEEQYLVMEHISGDDLSKRIEATQKPFPLSWVMFWADQLLDALSYLHSHEPPIIHRDIKPQNLKLTDENHIVLLDFGLSKSSDGQVDEATGSTGSVVGYTPHYAPMEQIRGIGTSARSDLYSLSATLYQLMTNTVPADALSRADSMLSGLADPITPPSDINQEVPVTVSDVILKGMEISQEKRFGTAREMQKALRKAFSEMQSAMNAATVAFNAADLDAGTLGTPASSSPSFDATEVMDAAALQGIADVVNSTPAADPLPSAPLNETVAFDANAVQDSGSLRQADVKTEVFIAGSTPFTTSGDADVSEYTPSEYSPSEYSAGTPAEPENFAPTTDYSNLGDQYGASATPESYTPEGTTPYVSFDGETASQPVGYETAVGTQQESEPEVASAVAVGSAAAVAAGPAKKKGGSGKIIALLGGLFIGLLLLGGLVGGGYYYYANYVAVEPTPSPTPEETPTPTPSPTPTATVDVLGDNTNTNTNSNSNGNSGVATDPTPAPTPREPSGGDSSPNQNPTPRPTRTPPRPQPTRSQPPPRTPRPPGDIQN